MNTQILYLKSNFKIMENFVFAKKKYINILKVSIYEKIIQIQISVYSKISILILKNLNKTI